MRYSAYVAVELYNGENTIQVIPVKLEELVVPTSRCGETSVEIKIWSKDMFRMIKLNRPYVGSN